MSGIVIDVVAGVRMQPVESSNLAAVGYAPGDDGAGTLYVKFKNGGLYAYAGVPASVHEALMGAASKGAHFIKHVRGAFACEKL